MIYITPRSGTRIGVHWCLGSAIGWLIGV